MWFLRRRSKSGEEADKALQEAQEAQQHVEESAAEVTSLADSFRELREQNHFAEKMAEIIVRRRGTLQ